MRALRTLCVTRLYLRQVRAIALERNELEALLFDMNSAPTKKHGELIDKCVPGMSAFWGLGNSISNSWLSLYFVVLCVSYVVILVVWYVEKGSRGTQFLMSCPQAYEYKWEMLSEVCYCSQRPNTVAREAPVGSCPT